ncbi:MAG: amidohydrolase [Agathobacter sp.]|nr:amidohydrolase [Agathobacter sp.]
MLIINGKIFTMEENECFKKAGAKNINIIERGYIRIKGKYIEEVGEMSQLRPKTYQEDILDVGGAWVLPGIIESHCHIGISEEKIGIIGDDCNEGTTPVTPALRALDAVNPMDAAFHDAIEAGITSVMVGPGSANVVGGQFLFMKTHGRCIDEMVVKTPAAMKVAFGENPKTCYGDKDEYPATRMGVAALLRKTLFEAVQYKNEKENGSLQKEDWELEPWLPVLKKEIPLKAHAHRADDILTAIRIAKEFDLDMTLDHGTESHLIAEQVKQSGFPVIVGPDLTSRSKLEVKNMNFKTNKVLQEHDILFSITTDHPVSMIQYLPLCAGLAVKRGLPMEEGLKAITINAAQICGVADIVGSLKKGKHADIAIFTGNPMEVFTKTLYTIINGEVVFDYRKDKEEG